MSVQKKKILSLEFNQGTIEIKIYKFNNQKYKK
jgi:hypothetical protein